MTKILAVLLVLVASAFAQVTAITSDGVVTITNTGTKTVVLYCVTATSTRSGMISRLDHDFYFKSMGMPPGMAMSTDLIADEDRARNIYDKDYTLTVTFQQFDDGSTVGDAVLSGAQSLIAQRKSVVAFATSLQNASGESAFVSLISAAIAGPSGSVQSVARHINLLYQQFGYAATLGKVADGLQAAASRKY